MSNVALKWAGEGSQMFIGRDSFGHVVISGSWPGVDDGWQEWKGLKPSDLLLISLGSCAAHDVVAILKRQRQTLTDLYITVNGTQEPNPPYAFTNIHLHYLLHGPALKPLKVERAITLAEEKYCSVAATLRCVVTHTFEIRPDALAPNPSPAEAEG